MGNYDFDLIVTPEEFKANKLRGQKEAADKKETIKAILFVLAMFVITPIVFYLVETFIK